MNDENKQKDFITTTAMFESFKKTCKHYVKLFGLTDWEIFYTHGIYKKETDYASVALDIAEKLAVIDLSKNWSNDLETHIEKSCEEHLRSCALHEVLDVIIADLELMPVKKLSKDERRTQKCLAHALVRRITNAILTIESDK